MRQKYNNNRRGFSLIEGIVAMFVLSVGVLAIVQLFSSTATQSKENGRYVSAMALAQEGVELFRTRRNDNIVKGESQFTGIDAGCYRVYVNNNATLVQGGCSSVEDAKLGVASNEVLYQHGGLSLPLYPPFWREVYVKDEDINGSTAKKITSVVYFRQPSMFPLEPNIDAQCTLANACVFARAILQ